MVLEVNKKFIAAAAVLFLFGAALGRYTTPVKVRIEKETITVEKKTEETQKNTKTDTDRDKHKETTVTETKNKDGTITKTTKTVEDTKTDRHSDQNSDTKKTDDISQKSTEKTEIIRGSSPVTVSLLIGTSMRFSGGSAVTPIIYGGSISKPVFGPISMGLWLLDNSTCGISLGLVF